jgi:hypothetical protein
VNVPAALQLPIHASNQKMRDIKMLMLIGIAHIRAVQDERVIEQGAVAVRRCLQLVRKICGRIKMVAIQLRKALDLRRIILVV